jgi:hypothetical protein
VITIPVILEMQQTLEAAGIACLMLVGGAVWYRSSRAKRRAAAPEIQTKIVDALSVYLAGNRDSGRLRALAAAHPDETRETILRFQTLVAGRCEELCELTIVLGYVQGWCRQAHSAGVKERREAFSYISRVAHYEPVRRLAGDIPAQALRDPDEQIRLEAARILLSTGDPEEMARVFACVLSETPAARRRIARELGCYAPQLCQAVIPQALQSEDPRDVLNLLVSWERALPLPDVLLLAKHPDPAVRVEVMRLLPFLPATPENRAALLTGLADEDHHVDAAAAAAARRVKLPNPEPVGVPAPGGLMELVPGGEGGGC